MLRRVIAIRNVGRFRNSVTTPNPTLAKYVVIFGANGFGKTTFCTILRSVQSGDAAPVIGRRTLGAPDNPEVDLLFADGNRRLQNGRWNSIEPSISVFDGTFVAENVHSGDVVDITNKRNLYRVIIGRAGVKLAETERSLAEEARAKQSELTTAEKVVRQICPSGLGLSEFLNLAPDPDIEAKIGAQKQAIGALREGEGIAARDELVQLPSPQIMDIDTLLRRSLKTAGEDAERLMFEHFSRHTMGTAGHQWVAEGMEFIASDECPFCGRDAVESLPLLKAYRAVFDSAYKALEDDIADAKQEIAAAIGDLSQERLRTLKAQNEAAIEFWRRHCPSVQERFPPLDNAFDEISRANTLFEGLLERKASQPHVALTNESVLGEAHDALSRAQTALSAYNAAVQTANAEIIEKKAQTCRGDLRSAQALLSRHEAIKLRQEQPVVTACNSLRRLDEEKRELETAKAAVRAELENHTRQVVQPYEQAINHFLDMFNAGFRIVRTTYAYPGGIASSTYQLLINNQYVDLGDARTPIDEPSFKNTLSAGDRTTLGLAIFLAQIDREDDIGARIVIFDDPFSSQDAFRRRQTIYEIMRVGNASAQVIVLSHDAQFLKQLWEKFSPDDRAALQITYSHSTGSKLSVFDLDMACRGRAAAELDDLMAFRASGAGNLREIIKKLRVVLETHFRSAYPGSFLATDNLGDLLRKIRDGGDAHPASASYEDLDRINDYTADYHHGEDPSGASEPPLDQQELLGFVNLTLKIVNALPQ